jgi:DNA-binding transcriptional ArsR family regulator
MAGFGYTSRANQIRQPHCAAGEMHGVISGRHRYFPEFRACDAGAKFEPLTGPHPHRILPFGYLTNWFYTMSTDRLSSKFAALADPTRRAILARLALGEISVGELAKPFAMSLPAVSKHLKVLEHAGLITRGREAQWRPCRLEPGALKDVDDWLEHYRRLWEERFDRLDTYLNALQGNEKKHTRRKRT